MYEKYLKKFAHTTNVSYETWKEIVKIIDDCEIYISGFKRKQYFDYLHAFYEIAQGENKDIMIVVEEYERGMKNTLGYQWYRMGKALTELWGEISNELQPHWNKLEELLTPKWKKIWRKIIKYLGGAK
jgi:hypothetical protein